MHQFSFNPIYMASSWTDRRQKMRKQFSLPILLPSGIGIDEIQVSLSEEGTALFIEVAWPDALMNQENLLSGFITDESCSHYTIDHAEVLSPDTNLKEFCTSIGAKRSEPIKTTSNIRFPYPVENSDFELILIPCKSKNTSSPEADVLLVHLFAVEEEYGDSINRKRPKLLVTQVDKMGF